MRNNVSYDSIRSEQELVKQPAVEYSFLVRLWKRFWRCVKIAFWCTLVPLGLVGCVLLVTALRIWSFSFHDETRTTDAAIILGAAVYTRTPSPVFAERIKHGVYLYEDGTVGKLIFTGGKDPYDKMSEAQAAKAMAVEAGVKADDILVENTSINTLSNLVNARNLMAENGLKSVLIVSDPLHMRRAMTIAEDLGIEAYSSPTATSRYQSFESQAGFLVQETLYYLSYLGKRSLGKTGG